jgi:SOS response regulatory protein OraA/RecX
LVDVSLDPKWRSDGSFKNGYTSVLEARLAEKLLDAKISAAPYIESRLRYFKTKYSTLEQMLNKSGFTWDPTKKMLQCKKQQYETHCMVCCLYDTLPETLVVYAVLHMLLLYMLLFQKCMIL